MAPKIAHKHHRGHGQPPLGLQGPAILATQFVLRFVWTSSTEDGTRYSRFHPSNYLSHHMARIVTAAVYADAEHICDGIIGLKQRALEFARAGDGADPPAA